MLKQKGNDLAKVLQGFDCCKLSSSEKFDIDAPESKPKLSFQS